MASIDDAVNSLSSEELDLLNSDPKMLADFKAKYSNPAQTIEAPTVPAYKNYTEKALAVAKGSIKAVSKPYLEGIKTFGTMTPEAGGMIGASTLVKNLSGGPANFLTKTVAGGLGATGGEFAKQIGQEVSGSTEAPKNVTESLKRGGGAFLRGSGATAIGEGIGSIAESAAKVFGSWGEKMMNIFLDTPIESLKSSIREGGDTLGRKALDSKEISDALPAIKGWDKKKVYDVSKKEAGNIQNEIEKEVAAVDLQEGQAGFNVIDTKKVADSLDPLIQQRLMVKTEASQQEAQALIRAKKYFLKNTPPAQSLVEADETRSAIDGLAAKKKNAFFVELEQNPLKKEIELSLANGYREQISQSAPTLAALNKKQSFFLSIKDSLEGSMAKSLKERPTRSFFGDLYGGGKGYIEQKAGQFANNLSIFPSQQVSSGLSDVMAQIFNNRSNKK